MAITTRVPKRKLDLHSGASKEDLPEKKVRVVNSYIVTPAGDLGKAYSKVRAATDSIFMAKVSMGRMQPPNKWKLDV